MMLTLFRNPICLWLRILYSSAFVFEAAVSYTNLNTSRIAHSCTSLRAAQNGKGISLTSGQFARGLRKTLRQQISLQGGTY